MCIAHLVRLLKKKTPVKDIGVDQIHEYYAARISEGASPNTVGYEISTLSAIFAVLMSKKNLTGITENPTELVRGRGALALNFASRKRQAYLSYDLINAITTVWNISTKRPLCPEWLSLLMWTAYYTGARLGELLGLQRHQVYLHKRMVYLTPTDQSIKEDNPKRIPIHRDLEPILERALRVRAFGIDNLFLLSDRRGTRPITKDCVELAMRRIKRVLNPNPSFSFHHTRHTWRANASRSDIPDRVAERILGHADKLLAVSERYGSISDAEFIANIDKFTVFNGDSEIDGKPVSLFGLRQNTQPSSTDTKDKPFQAIKSAKKKAALG